MMNSEKNVFPISPQYGQNEKYSWYHLDTQQESKGDMNENKSSEVEIEILRGQMTTSAATLDGKMNTLSESLGGKMDTLLANVESAMANNRTDFAKLETSFSEHRKWILGSTLTAVAVVVGILMRYYPYITSITIPK